MGTPLNTRAPALPSLKLRTVGDHADVAVIDIDVVPRYIFGTTTVKLSPPGKPLTQDKVTVLVVGGKAVIGDDNDHPRTLNNGKTVPGDRPANTGEVSAIYVAGRDRWDPDLDKLRSGDVGRSFSEAQKAAGGLQVGDVMRWKFEAEVPGQGESPRRIRTYQIRRPRPEEAEQAQRCEQIRLEAGQTPLGGGGGGTGYPDDEIDEEPF